MQGLTPFDVPFYWTNVANTPRLHWDYPGVNVAKALGGCGIHNAMLYGKQWQHHARLFVMYVAIWANLLGVVNLFVSSCTPSGYGSLGDEEMDVGQGAGDLPADGGF